MKLLVSQKNYLAELIDSIGANLAYFEFIEDPLYGSTIYVANNKDFVFNMRETIQGAGFCDIYYTPTNKQACKHIYLSIDRFEEIIPYFQEWLDCISLEVGLEDRWQKEQI